MLLARLGVGQIVVIDNDIVDRTNLNRLHGARQADADAMTPKVNVVARAVSELGLGIRIVPIEAWVGDPGCRNALRSCDLIFGCTDDNEGRVFLNRLAYFYLIPVIDLGLAIDVSRSEPPEINCLDGRVTVLAPPQARLSCRGVIDHVAARDEALRRRSPSEYARQKAEAYVAGEGNPRPAVVTFTTEVASMAVNEMLQASRLPRDERQRSAAGAEISSGRRLPAWLQTSRGLPRLWRQHCMGSRRRRSFP